MFGPSVPVIETGNNEEQRQVVERWMTSLEISLTAVQKLRETFRRVPSLG